MCVNDNFLIPRRSGSNNCANSSNSSGSNSSSNSSGSSMVKTY